MLRAFMATVMLVVTAATVSAQAAPAKADIDPIGEYAVELSFQGQPVAVTCKIEKKADGTIGGYLTAQGIDAIPLKSVSVKETTITIISFAPDGSETNIQFTVNDDETLTGKWTMQGDGSPISGKRTKKG